MVEYTGREVLLKDENGEVIIPYVSYASSGRNIGDIFYTSRLDTELNGAVECNGGTYDTSDFSGSQSIGNLLSGGNVPYVSLTEYASIVSSNGSCRAFGWDGGTSFRVPLLNDVYIEAGTAESAGEFIKESLPNITGQTGSGFRNYGDASSGALYGENSYDKAPVDGNYTGLTNLKFDASRSSSTYQNGAKVKPDSVRYRAMVQLAITATEDAVITATSALQQLANVVNTTDNQEIGGLKTFTNDIVKIRDEGSLNYITEMKSLTPNTAPSENLYGCYRINDSNGNEIGNFYYRADTGGDFSVRMGTKSLDGSKSHWIGVGFKGDNSLYTYAPACSVANSIVTTSAISKSGNGYVKLGNGIIICWGSVASGSSVTVTFPTAFTATPRVASSTTQGSGGGYERVVVDITKTGFTSKGYGGAKDYTSNYIAIGY